MCQDKARVCGDSGPADLYKPSGKVVVKCATCGDENKTSFVFNRETKEHFCLECQEDNRNKCILDSI
jgi:hypothetical protein